MATPTAPVPEPKPAPKRGMKERFASLLQFVIRDSGAEKGVSDAELRGKLNDALRADEPGFMGVYEVYPADNLVIYEVCPADEWMTMRRSYATGADGSITFSSKPEQVETVVSYEPVNRAAALKVACGCGDKPITLEVTEMAKTKTERAAALAAHKHNTVKDIKTLEAASDEVLTVLESHADALAAEETAQLAKDEAVKTAKAEADRLSAAATGQPKAQTEVEFLAAHPSIKSIVDQHNAKQVEMKTALVSQLKTAAAGVYSDEELGKMTVPELQKLATLAKVDAPAGDIDFSGMGVAVPHIAAAGANYDAPDGYAAVLDKKATVN